jgi:hypothetical protein
MKVRLPKWGLEKGDLLASMCDGVRLRWLLLTNTPLAYMREGEGFLLPIEGDEVRVTYRAQGSFTQPLYRQTPPVQYGYMFEAEDVV